MYIEEKANQLINELTENNVDFSIDGISSFLGIFIMYNDDISCYMEYRNYPFIYIKKDNPHKMWEEFTHELGHYLLHNTDQRIMNEMYNYKLENEANKFSILFRMPQQVIEDFELFSESQLMSFFNEKKQNARKRIDLLYNYYLSTSAIGV